MQTKPILAASSGPRSRPRVVILDTSADAAVGILELPGAADVGTEFRHQEASWRVTARRPHTRVLFAERLL